MTEAEINLLNEGIHLAINGAIAVFTAWHSAGAQGPIDWSSVRITKTPEQALADAEAAARPS